MRRAFLLLLVLLFPVQASAAKLTCRPAIKYIVEAGGTSPSDVGSIYTVVDTTKKTVSRCDTKGCDQYRVTFAKSAAFTNIQSTQPNGYMLKMMIDSKTLYMEQATIGFTSIIYYGTCQ